MNANLKSILFIILGVVLVVLALLGWSPLALVLGLVAAAVVLVPQIGSMIPGNSLLIAAAAVSAVGLVLMALNSSAALTGAVLAIGGGLFVGLGAKAFMPARAAA